MKVKGRKTFIKDLIFIYTAAFLSILFSISLCAGEKIEIGSVKQLKITVLYDNYVYIDGTQPDWGFACLVEGPEKTILFDTGGKPEVLKENIQKLNIDLSKIDLLAVSHNHWDHIGGLPAVYEIKSPLDVFLPVALLAEESKKFSKEKAIFNVAEKSANLCSGVLLTGALGSEIKEQALIINTPKGIVVITGCAHPGIVEMLKSAKEMTGRNIYLVVGGFHLLRHSDEEVNRIIAELKSLSVEKCSASHCTGDRAIDLFKKSFAENYLPAGTGRVFVIE